MGGERNDEGSNKEEQKDRHHSLYSTQCIEKWKMMISEKEVAG